MQYSKVAKKGGVTTAYASIGMFVEWVANVKLGLGAPGGMVTGGVTAALASLQNWLKNR